MFIKFYKCVKIENITIFTNNLYLENVSFEIFGSNIQKIKNKINKSDSENFKPFF